LRISRNDVPSAASCRRGVRSEAFDAGIRPFVLTHDDKLMYAQLFWLHGLVEVELATGKTLRTIELPVSEDAMQVSCSASWRYPSYPPFARAPANNARPSGEENAIAAAGSGRRQKASSTGKS
jgi:hypothetical protein